MSSSTRISASISSSRMRPLECVGFGLARALFTPEFFASRSGSGAAARDPIFIVGLPRAGSTLLEQILSSHPDVEGTMELPDLISIVQDLAGRRLRSN